MLMLMPVGVGFCMFGSGCLAIPQKRTMYQSTFFVANKKLFKLISLIFVYGK